MMKKDKPESETRSYESKTSSEALRRVFRPLVFKEQMNQLSVYTRPCCRPLARSSWSSGWPSLEVCCPVDVYLTISPARAFASSERPRLFTCVRWTRACACASSSALLERTISYHRAQNTHAIAVIPFDYLPPIRSNFIIILASFDDFGSR